MTDSKHLLATAELNLKMAETGLSDSTSVGLGARKTSSSGLSQTNLTNLRAELRTAEPAKPKGDSLSQDVIKLSSLLAAPKKTKRAPERKTKGGLRRPQSKSTGDLLRRNRISFGTSNTRIFERQIEDEAHKNDVWFSDKEYQDISTNLLAKDNKVETTRGLESFEKDSGARGKRRAHQRAILQLQTQQRQTGIQDDHSFHLLSRAMSGEDLRNAQALASVDSSQALQEHLKTPATCITRTSSTKALDNFRKNMILSTGALDHKYYANKHNPLLLQRSGNGGGQNATFASSFSNNTRRSKKTPNLFLQAMATKDKVVRERTQSRPQRPPAKRGVAGVA